MNYRVVLKLLGNVLKYEIFLLIIPLLVALYYGDGDALSFLITIGLMVPLMIYLCKIRIDKKEIYAKEGFLTVGLAWILISVVGALPFVISGAIPSFIDAFFETS